MLWDTILLSLREIRRNVMRSSLTILGIVIGVAAVITMVTLGKGATLQVASDIAKLGTNMLLLRPGQRFRGPGGTRFTATMFDVKDAEAIKRNILGLAAVPPTASARLQAIFGNENWSTTITGSDNAFLQVRSWSLREGRKFTDNELQSGKAVCILGATVRDNLFGSQDPLGSMIRLKRLSCQVIGVLESKGQSSFGSDQDDFVLIPLRTFQRRVSGSKDVDVIFLSAQEGASTEKIQQDVERLMRERRHITQGEEDDFNVRDMKEIVSTLTGTTKLLTALLAFLFSGFVGVMFGFFPARQAARLNPIDALRHE